MRGDSRRATPGRYNPTAYGAFAGIEGILPTVRAGARSAWHLYTIRVPARDGLAGRMKNRGIASAVRCPTPLHVQPAMATARGRAGQLPVTEQLCREVISLPLYPALPLEATDRIAGAVREPAGAGVHA